MPTAGLLLDYILVIMTSYGRRRRADLKTPKLLSHRSLKLCVLPGSPTVGVSGLPYDQFNHVALFHSPV